MAAMEDMLAKMLQKAIPPEVLQLLTPDKINEFGERINAYIVDNRERLERIENAQADIMERLDNVGSKGSNRRRDASGAGGGD